MAFVTALNTAAPSSLNNEKAHTVNKSYVKEAKNAKALVQATSWLKAANIPVKPSTTPGCDLTIQTKAGKSIEIKVAVDSAEPRPAAEHLLVLAADLTHRNKSKALETFHSITSGAGYGTPSPINRGEDPTKKMHFDDNFELVAMRHKEFRKVPNPTADELAHFDKVISKAVSRFVFINTKICRRHGLGFDDLKTYAQIWTCNYLGLYKVANPTNNDNERKLYTHLCQRFSNFIEVLLKKERNCLPDSQTAHIAQTGTPYQGRAKTRLAAVIDAAELSFEEVMEAQQEEEVEPQDLAEAEIIPDGFTLFTLPESAQSSADDEEREQKITDAKRRKLAQKQLAEEFSKLDHDTLITTLEAVAINTHLCYDARAEAKKQLRLHREACTSCAEVREGVN